MVRMGYDAIIVPQRLAPLKDYAYTPYIFSDRELGSLLNAVDQLCAAGISIADWCAVHQYADSRRYPH